LFLRRRQAESEELRALPHLHESCRISAGQHLLGKAELVIDLHRSGLDFHCSRLLSRPRLAVDHDSWNAPTGQHETCHQTGWTGADDQHIGVDDWKVLHCNGGHELSPSACQWHTSRADFGIRSVDCTAILRALEKKSTIVDLSYHEVMAKNGKRTGRPAGMGDVNKRRQLEADREQFSSQGFRGVTMRAIGAQAGVDVALIARHFGSKDGLFAAAVELPEEAPEILATALSAPLQEQGERLARGYLGLWEDPATSAQMLSLARASFNHEGAGARLGESIMGAEV